MTTSDSTLQQQQSQPQPQQYALTSTTAPGKIFTSRAELADHYKSDWHKYNLKRREAGLPVLLQADFEARLQAAKALRYEKQAGKDHLKDKANAKKKQPGQRSSSSSTEANHNRVMEKPIEEANEDRVKADEDRAKPTENSANVIAEPTAKVKGTEALKANSENVKNETIHDKADNDNDDDNDDVVEDGDKEEPLEIDPCQSLFDKRTFDSVQENLDYMLRQYGFFIPDGEYLTDSEGLIGYCHEQIRLGHMCLYCHRVFTTWQGCQKHMIAKSHTKLRYETPDDMEDWAVFYDFTAADREFLGSLPKQNKKLSRKNGEDEDDDEWEDMSEDGENGVSPDDMDEDEKEEEADDDDDLYDEYMTSMGFDLTPLGELIFPDGRIVGHRLLRRYYKQRAPRQHRENNTAVAAARLAAGERLFRGRVHQIHPQQLVANGGPMSKALSSMPAPMNGLIVPAADGTISQVSLYRYRAAIRKQRLGEEKGRRLYHRTNMNMNRMDKKANRIMNGVSVAHAAR